jgi:hypothetical protein
MRERYFFGGPQASPVRPSGKSNVHEEEYETFVEFVPRRSYKSQIS